MCRLNVDYNVGIKKENQASPLVRLDWSRGDVLAAVLSRALQDDPGFRYVMPNREDRLRLLPDLFRGLIHASQVCGQIDTVPAVEGGALWIPPEGALTIWQTVRTRLLSMPLQLPVSALRRFMALTVCLEEVQNHVAGKPHWYLLAWGTDSSKRGRETLIEPGLSRAKSGGFPCYAETLDEKKLPFYKRLGFRIAAAGKIPGGGPDFWVMIRT
jgi:hypothetical protein